MTDTLDWSKCPICGKTEEFGIHSEDRLYSTNSLHLIRDGARFVTAEWGDSEVDWSTAVTRGYYTDCCGEALPEAYQDALDEALLICRDPEA